MSLLKSCSRHSSLPFREAVARVRLIDDSINDNGETVKVKISNAHLCVEGEVGYGLPVGSRFVGTPRVGVSTSEYGRDYRIGYGLGVLDRERLNLELGVDAHRRESPMRDGTDNGFLGRATMRW